MNIDDVKENLKSIVNSFEHRNPEYDPEFLEDCLKLAYDRLKWDWAREDVENALKSELNEHEEFVLASE